jgi:short subunit dehydrogenase-like uncharacterized protein
MLYGANGYTGELIAREAVRRGLRPLLAGRSAERVEPLARELGLEWRAFGLMDVDLSGVAVVLHCAGPFIHTSGPMAEACLAAGVHYLDITGEIEVFESLFARDAEAKRRGVALIPGVGFDVVPTDCLAAQLHARLPDARELWLAFDSGRSGISRGTLKTMLEGLGDGGAIRVDGAIVRVPMLYDVREIPFAGGARTAMTIPWGDVATAYRTTGIPNIRVYHATSPRQIARLRRMRPLLPLARFGMVKRALQRFASKHASPTASERAAARVELWGRVANERGEEVTMTMSTPDGYDFTVASALAAIERLLADEVRPGAWTPSRYFDSDFAEHTVCSMTPSS